MIKKYSIAWLGMMVLAILNGAFRDFTYKSWMGPLFAHQVSTVLLMLILAAYMYRLQKKWAITSTLQAISIGALWCLLTELFEFGMGLSRGLTFQDLLKAYAVTDGQIWILIPLWVLIGPYTIYRLTRTKASRMKQ